jgi:hypothetical protein
MTELVPITEKSDIELLGNIIDQMNPKGPARSKFGFGISPALERAKVARPPKPAIEKVKPPVTVEVTVPSVPDQPVGEITDYASLIEAMRLRAEQLGISRETISEIAGLPDRYASKILSLKCVRRVGMQSLGPLLDALGLKLVAIPDEEALARNRLRYVPRDAAHT